MKLRIALHALGLLVVSASQVSALTTLARCGPSTGQSYYFEGGIVGPGQGGWKPDGFANGRITVVIRESEQLDIWLKDASGLKSYIKEGYKIGLVKIDEKGRSFLITAHGSAFVETYLFKINEHGVGTVTWTASKLTDTVTRTSIMVAECGPKHEILQ